MVTIEEDETVNVWDAKDSLTSPSLSSAEIMTDGILLTLFDVMATE